MSQQPTKYEHKAFVYGQIQALDGVCEVEMFDFAERGVGIFIVGGDDQEISEAFAMHTCRWNQDWYVGDTEYKREFFTPKWYRCYDNFQNKYRELSGNVDFDFRAPDEEEAIIYS